MPPLTPLSLDDSLITSLAVRQDVRAAKVLIVDRDPDFVESLRRVVGEAGYPTVGAHTATEALATIKSEGCQIVILDREMPEIDGLVLCAAIRAARVLPGYVYIILRSSQDSEKDILIGLQAGADEYVSKQMPATQLIARLMTAQRILALEHGLRIDARRTDALGHDGFAHRRAKSAMFRSGAQTGSEDRSALRR